MNEKLLKGKYDKSFGDIFICRKCYYNFRTYVSFIYYTYNIEHVFEILRIVSTVHRQFESSQGDCEECFRSFLILAHTRIVQFTVNSCFGRWTTFFQKNLKFWTDDFLYKVSICKTKTKNKNMDEQYPL